MAGWTMGAFTPCSERRARGGRISQQARKRSCGIRELRLRRPFGASRRTDDENGRKRRFEECDVIAIGDGCYLDSTFFTGANDPVEPECRPAPPAGRKLSSQKGQTAAAVLAHRFSGSDWNFLRARNSSPHWGLVGAMLSVWRGNSNPQQTARTDE
jgi:hypothetical protein